MKASCWTAAAAALLLAACNNQSQPALEITTRGGGIRRIEVRREGA
jgi:hypothetical protein